MSGEWIIQKLRVEAGRPAMKLREKSKQDCLGQSGGNRNGGGSLCEICFLGRINRTAVDLDVEDVKKRSQARCLGFCLEQVSWMIVPFTKTEKTIWRENTILDILGCGYLLEIQEEKSQRQINLPFRSSGLGLRKEI